MAVFVSYRRDDSEDVTGRIYEHLAKHLGQKSVFKDVDSIPYGTDFREAIATALEECDVVLAVIGPTWLNCTDENGKRRLDDRNDFVRVELETALENGIRVIPVLVGGATLPASQNLPKSLEKIIYLNSAQVRADPDFVNDVARLQSQLGTSVESRATASRSALPRGSRFGLASQMLLGMALLAALGAVWWFAGDWPPDLGGGGPGPGGSGDAGSSDAGSSDAGSGLECCEPPLLQLERADFEIGNVPDGWEAASSIAVRESNGIVSLGPNSTGSHRLSSPEVKITGDFYCAVEVYYDAAAQLDMQLIGDAGQPDLSASFHTTGRGVWRVSSTGRFEPVHVASTSQGPTRFRIERRAASYEVLVDGKPGASFRTEQSGTFKGIILYFEGNHIGMTRLEMGALGEPRAVVTSPYKLSIQEQQWGRKPAGWSGSSTVSVQKHGEVSALAPDSEGRHRVGSPVLCLGRNFSVDFEVAWTATTELLLTLTGCEGGRDFGLHVSNKGNPYGVTWRVKFGDKEWQANVQKGPVRVQLQREEETYRVFLNGQPVAAFSTDVYQNFDGVLFDFFDKHTGLATFEVEPN